MKDQKKIRLWLGLGLLVVLLLISSLIFIGWHWWENAPQQSFSPAPTFNQGTPDQSTEQSNQIDQTTSTVEEAEGTVASSTPPGSSNETATTEPIPATLETPAAESASDETQQLKKFLSVYFTWELKEKSVADRAQLLQELMSPDCYDGQEIAADSVALQELIQTYEKKKEINTSNAIQLVASRYLASEIYQATTDPTLYTAKVKIEQKAPYQTKGFIGQQVYHIRFEKGKVTQLERLNVATKEEIQDESSNAK
ncbi:hypothetical protein [Enterococcus sp. DIV1420a]|uniref:hypothetical protein n=1 Tax=Enterococcus sp. DIV1420a TaxID=2774672 RepID=UPI003F204A50